MDRFQRSIYGKGDTDQSLQDRASYGLSGWDGNLSHELWRQSYGSGGAGYNFGVNAGGQSGGSEGEFAGYRSGSGKITESDFLD